MKLIKNKNGLKLLRKRFKEKKIGLCHGVFDILHFGHIEHFKEAKKNCDILVISLTSDEYVKKGPRQPYNNQFKRSTVLQSLEACDNVYINKKLTAIDVIKNLKPNIYFKGQDYLKKDYTNNLKKEIREVKKNNGKFFITKTKLMSSSHILNNNLINWNEEQIKNINQIKKNISFNDIVKTFEMISKQEITVIGEPIIDKYSYCEVSGKTSKDPTLSLVKKNTFDFSGGVISIAQILSKFYKKVTLITFGNLSVLKKFLRGFNNIKVISITNDKIQEKERFINEGRIQKLFQVANFKNINFNKNYLHSVLKKINSSYSKNLIIADFGIGVFSKDLIKSLEKCKKDLFVNVQTNSLNFGTNVFTKYKNYKYLSLDLKEWQVGFQLLNPDLKIIEKKISKLKGNKSITLGQNGSIYLSGNEKYYSPVFDEKLIDTTGCGDAYFAITSMLISQKDLPKNLIPFLGNLYAGMHGKYLGNSKITGTTAYLKYINSLFKI